MASVALDFLPPAVPDIVKLSIYEGIEQDGEYTLIEEITEIGVYPNYITRYTTEEATNSAGWFRIQWTDNKGATTEFSGAIQGGTYLLISKLMDRVMLRDATLDENLVSQACEWVISKFFITENPYDVTLAATYNQLEGLTLLSLARALLHTLAQASMDESYTAGLVSQKAGVGNLAGRKDIIATLVNEANNILGLNFTVVMLLENADPLGMGTISTMGLVQPQLLSIELE
jgi:hypothetical protein